ncbi:protein SRC2 [Physcomitrium patens]|uniref:C2 domain-containing protein n=1 Tax=Physcomitrium patens TaxID=3218 RepID=A0A2K1IRQ5_PHYPA|nr:protein SRC2-like [Physcomitrium patens]XP_024359453.1 protein SRC2-like [Physcomitrium patens]PNR31961.1 hypothetical protein PHYPA_026085 [Physcomitrium patens]|eukprot:XP_024359452.1 protein SRC2-like [Physcomitrella patens]
MAQRELEVTVISAQGLKNVRLYGRLMNPYAVAWVYPSHKVQTVVDEGGGINPSWNSVLRFSCEDTVIWSSGGEITIVIRNRGSISNKLIGTVTVPLSDLSLQCRAADSNASPESTLMSYQVKTRLGKPRGVLNLAVKVGTVLKTTERTASVAPHMPYPPKATYPVYPANSTGHNEAAAAAAKLSAYFKDNQHLYPPQQPYPPQQASPLHQMYPPQQPYLSQQKSSPQNNYPPRQTYPPQQVF